MSYRTIVVVSFTAALAVAGSQTGCNDNPSPTAPALPQQPLPSPVMSRATYTLLIKPVNEDREYPRGGELLVDGQSVWAGDVPAPGEAGYFSGYSYYYDDSLPSNVGAQRTGALSEGRHVLTFRVTDQRRSPTGYSLSGRVELVWSNNRVLLAASWLDVPARLRTGEEWSTEFVVPAAPPS